MAKTRKHPLRHKLFLIKEVIFAFLAVSSIVLVIYEFITEPSPETLKTLNHIDIAIALVFLTDFILSLLLTSDRKRYIKHNWYFLFASIPLTDSVAEILRGLRFLRFIRLIRAGEHLEYSVTKR